MSPLATVDRPILQPPPRRGTGPAGAPPASAGRWDSPATMAKPTSAPRHSTIRSASPAGRLSQTAQANLANGLGSRRRCRKVRTISLFRRVGHLSLEGEVGVPATAQLLRKRQPQQELISRYGTHQAALTICARTKQRPFPHRRLCCPTARPVLRPPPTPSRHARPLPGSTPVTGSRTALSTPSRSALGRGGPPQFPPPPSERSAPCYAGESLAAAPPGSSPLPWPSP